MMPGDALSADDAFLALRHYGRWALVRDAFIRFRYGDGFSHALRSGIERWFLEDPHGTIPENRSSLGDDIGECGNGGRTDIENSLFGWYLIDRDNAAFPVD